jgi:3,4-dihydroxy-2-butanone 4-phosphate synthase
VAIARLAGQVPATIGAEMLQPDGDGALSVAAAREYASERGIPMITGADLLGALGIE